MPQPDRDENKSSLGTVYRSDSIRLTSSRPALIPVHEGEHSQRDQSFGNASVSEIPQAWLVSKEAIPARYSRFHAGTETKPRQALRQR